MDMVDYCKCDERVPITWLGTCDQCKKPYLFPRKRIRVTHPIPLKQSLEIFRDALTKTCNGYTYTFDEDAYWSPIFEKLLDAEFFSIEKGYFLMGCGIFLNPKLYRHCDLYFVYKKGAELFKSIHYKNAMYRVDICKK